MKTIATSQNNTFNKVLLIMGFLFVATFLYSPLLAQNKSVTVKGAIKSDIGPLDGVSIYLKNSKTGTVSKSDGTFSFPSKLKLGDVLIFSYLGYEKQEIIIKPSSSYLDIFLNEAPIDVLSAVNTNRPFKSKRSKSN